MLPFEGVAGLHPCAAVRAERESACGQSRSWRGRRAATGDDGLAVGSFGDAAGVSDAFPPAGSVGEKRHLPNQCGSAQAEVERRRAFEIVQGAGGWMFRTRPVYAPAIRAAADVGDQLLDLSEFDVAVLAAIAYHQPITRDGLKDIFGKEISRDLIGRLSERGLIATGPRAPRRGAPYTFVTTGQFLTVFGLESLRDLPDREQLGDAGRAARP